MLVYYCQIIRCFRSNIKSVESHLNSLRREKINLRLPATHIGTLMSWSQQKIWAKSFHSRGAALPRTGSVGVIKNRKGKMATVRKGADVMFIVWPLRWILRMLSSLHARTDLKTRTRSSLQAVASKCHCRIRCSSCIYQLISSKLHVSFTADLESSCQTWGPKATKWVQ